MKATELKCKNYIDLYGQVAQIVPNDFVKWCDEKWEMKDFKPIPLTEEWLLKFGFKKFENYEIYNKGDFQCDKTQPEQEEEGYWFFIEGYAVNIKYVHQLQNLYFVLCGEELIIKC